MTNSAAAHFLPVLAMAVLGLAADAACPQLPKSIERERDRAYARQMFQKNFKTVQVLTQELLREHEAGRLTPERLGKDARTLQKSARTLRALQALGEMAKPTDINPNIRTPDEFDAAIRRLAKFIYDYAHNSIHQNSKVFNTDEAERAQTDLLAAIQLAKAIESKSKSYATGATGR
jgi:hypothetical protein